MEGQFWFVVFLTLISTDFAVAQDDIDLARLSGKEVYVSFCSRCHGEDGTGQIPPEMIENMEAPPPDLTEGYFSSREKRKDWEAVTAGGGGVRGLSMSMPAWGDVLTPQQITEIVEHMKSFVDQSLYPQGETNLIRAHQVTKAFVEQEFLFLPTVTSAFGVTEYESVLYYADRMGNRWQHEVKLPFLRRTDAIGSSYGIGNLELGVKYCFYDDFRDQEIASVGVETGLPTGSSSVGLGGFGTSLAAFVAVGKGFGNALQVQASVKVEGSVASFFDSYEIKTGISATIPLSDSKYGFFPGMEGIVLIDPHRNTTAVTLLPKLYWGMTLRGHLALSIGPELRVSGPKTYDTRWRMFFLWDYVDGGIWW